MAATYSEIRGYCIGLRFVFMPGAEMPSWLGLTIAGSWCPAHLKTISFQSSKITNCFISSKTFPPLFVVKITAPIHTRDCDAGAAGGIADAHLFIYICADFGRRKLCKMPFFFALLVLGIYYYHHLIHIHSILRLLMCSTSLLILRVGDLVPRESWMNLKDRISRSLIGIKKVIML